ncbi:Aste57867_18835 [Aphanomyces stellatus]|uniref:Aste57867_18835 protein n=1 Tax=Aphanomyces stellatus TaxID=120398 RepID=A0A485LCL3_9STRA|nr:hypothetical protein As57867_018771 [Aphanomyces stellatus]VFT95569.1 Aste57867_18835 [Aphanomyces stellatus]
MKAIQKLLDQHGIKQVVEAVLEARRSPPQALRVLGLDINTNSTGYAVLNQAGRLESYGHVSTKHLQSDTQMLDIGVAIAARLKQLETDHHASSGVAWHVGIEDFLRTFSGGNFHTKGLFQLAQLNGLVSYCALTTFGVPPVHVHPTAARAFFALQVPSDAKPLKKKKDAIKHIVHAHLLASEPALDMGRLAVTVQQDIADAYVVASYTWWQAVVDQVLLQAAPTLETWRPAMESILAKQIEKKTTKKLSKDAYLDAVLRDEVVTWVREHRNDM